jgi:hypothetical protein
VVRTTFPAFESLAQIYRSKQRNLQRLNMARSGEEASSRPGLCRAVSCCGVCVLQGIEGFAADQKKLEDQLAKLAADMKH